MKQYYSILAALLLSFSASSLNAQYLNIPDANFKAYLISCPANTTLDFEIDSLEALNYTGTIDISGLNITDLTGLERFTAITSFRCAGTPITSLDLSTNIMLTNLHCGGNPFTTLDLSNNINLTHLLCQQQQITHLDLSNNVNLVYLDCQYDSSLVSLNLKNGNNTAILNPINNLFVSNNPLLNCIEVDDSLYSTTNWVNIDATANFSENCHYLGTNQLEQTIPNLQVYPNPTHQALTIDLGATHSVVNINVLNTIGQRVQSVNYTNTQALGLNIKGLPGWYFIQIETEKGSKTIKILKQ